MVNSGKFFDRETPQVDATAERTGSRWKYAPFRAYSFLIGRHTCPFSALIETRSWCVFTNRSWYELTRP